jgi:hypothetical protein
MAKNNKEVQRMVAEKNATDANKESMELISHFKSDFEIFQNSMVEKYGMMIGCRLHADETSIKAILVPVKVPKKNETETQ